MRVFFGANESGVAWWRAKQPAWKLQELGLCDVELFSLKDNSFEEASQMIDRADIVYTPSPCGIDSVVEFAKYKQAKKRVIADYDDDLFECHPLNPGYKTLGLKEVKVRVGDGPEQHLWKDQKKGFSIKDNYMRHRSHVDLLNMVDIITTPSPYLAERMMNKSGRDPQSFSVLPNAVDFVRFQSFDKRLRSTDKLRVGWVASDSHLLECEMFRDIVQETLRKDSNIQFVVLGNIMEFRQSVKHLPIEWHNFVDLEVYPIKIASLELDIAICPLEDFEFNRSKSCLKWSEMSAIKVPCVVSDVVPYQMIDHGLDGMVADTRDSFVNHILTLAHNRQLRESIKQSAYDRNFDDFNLDKVAYDWLDTFNRAMDSNRQINFNGSKLETSTNGVSASV